MSLVITDPNHPTTVECAGHTYDLHVGEDDALYIEEVNQKALTISISDVESTVTVQGQWVNIRVREEK